MALSALITGGLGYVGSWITSSLVGAGFEVTSLARTDDSVLTGLPFERFVADVTNIDDLRRVCEGRSWDVVIHLASIYDSSDPDFFRTSLITNTLGTRNVLEMLANPPVAMPHFIYFSTFHVYGLSSGSIDASSVPPLPRNDYASTHLFAEYYVRQFGLSHSLPYTILRLTNAYGAPKRPTGSGWHLVVNDLVRMAVCDRAIKLRSNGTARRDMVWLGDVSDAVIRCIEAGPANETFDLGSGSSMSVIEIATVVRNAYHEKTGIAVPITSNEQDIMAAPDDISVSISRLQQWIKFEPTDRLFDEASAAIDLLNSVNKREPT